MKKHLIAAALVASAMPAQATMPVLTERPKAPTPATCEAWAKAQDEDALYMWGMQDSGQSSNDLGVKRLTRNCLGFKTPPIVGFGSSAGFDRDYCAKHHAQKICRQGVR